MPGGDPVETVEMRDFEKAGKLMLGIGAAVHSQAVELCGQRLQLRQAKLIEHVGAVV